MADRVIQRNDTAARWKEVNPVLAMGEIGIETDGAKGYKIGDGVTRWNDLAYPANPTSVVQEGGTSETAVMSQKAVSEKIGEVEKKTDDMYVQLNGQIPTDVRYNIDTTANTNILSTDRHNFNGNKGDVIGIRYINDNGALSSSVKSIGIYTYNKDGVKIDTFNATTSYAEFTLSDDCVAWATYIGKGNVLGGVFSVIFSLPKKSGIIEEIENVKEYDVVLDNRLNVVEEKVLPTTKDYTDNLVLYQDNRFVKTNGYVSDSDNPNYSVYKLNLDGVRYESFDVQTQVGSGTTLSLAYAYDSNDNPLYQVRGCYADDANKLVSFSIGNNPAWSYILLTYIKSVEKPTLAVDIHRKAELAADNIKTNHIHVSVGESLVNVIYGLMIDETENKPSKTNRYIIQLDEGEYSLDCSSIKGELGNTTSDRFYHGLQVPDYVSLRGCGKGVTVLKWHYDGTDNWIKSEYSGLNVFDNSDIEHLTIDVQNLRYAIHSIANDNAAILLNDVSLIHRGFDTEHGTFYAPSAWGASTRNNNDLRFVNCDFVSYENKAWANHDVKDVTRSSRFSFESCSFITNLTNGASVWLNSYGSGVKMPVNFVNCKFSNYIQFNIESSDSNADVDYIVNCDTEVLIKNSTTNNAHKKQHYIIGGCHYVKFAQARAMGTPVILSNYMEANVWDGVVNAAVVDGILLHDVSANECGVVMQRGIMFASQVLGKSFNRGDLIGYANGEWKVVENNPLLIAINNNIVKLL